MKFLSAIAKNAAKSIFKPRTTRFLLKRIMRIADIPADGESPLGNLIDRGATLARLILMNPVKDYALAISVSEITINHSPL